jgi:flagellar basal body rod protein FlgG
VTSITQNGYATGQLSTVSIDTTGIVSAVYTNGRSTQLGQLALANFPNPQGLKQLGDTNWSQTFASGTVVQGTAGSAGFGSIQSGALESSNVDLTTELVNMITAQRAFDANAQVITTANQESQTVIAITINAGASMDRGLYVSMTGAKQIMQAQAVNNHNIANVNTVGFRADTVAFVSEPIYGPGYPTRVNAVAGDCGHRFLDRRAAKHRPRSTWRSTARASSRCMAPDGKEAYTRAGDLQVTADGAVTTANGLPVMSEQGPLERAAGDLGDHRQRRHGLGGAARPDSGGAVAGRPHQAGQSADRRPAKGPGRAAAAQVGGKAPTDETVTVQSGMLESSNVNAAQSLVNMIELQRLYEFQIKSMNSTDQNEQTAERLMLSTYDGQGTNPMNLALWAAKPASTRRTRRWR